MKRRGLVIGGALSAYWSAALSQPAERVYRVGVLCPGARPPPATDPQLLGIRNALRVAGYAEGQNLVYEERFAGGDVSPRFAGRPALSLRTRDQSEDREGDGLDPSAAVAAAGG